MSGGADGHKADSEPEGKRRAKEEAAGIEPHDHFRFAGAGFVCRSRVCVVVDVGGGVGGGSKRGSSCSRGRGRVSLSRRVPLGRRAPLLGRAPLGRKVAF